MLRWKTNRKKKPPRKAVLFHEYQASTGRSNKFVSLLAASLCFSFMITVSERACLRAHLFYYRPPMLRKRILVLLQTIPEASLTRYGCVSANILNWGGSTITSAFWSPTATNVKHDCVFPLSWKSAWNHVCPFCFTAANCDGAGTVTAIFQEACLELTDLLVRVCLCTPQLHLTVTWVVWSHGG